VEIQEVEMSTLTGGLCFVGSINHVGVVARVWIKSKLKLSPYQALEANKVVRC
jgi:hypothetical protein